MNKDIKKQYLVFHIDIFSKKYNFNVISRDNTLKIIYSLQIISYNFIIRSEYMIITTQQLKEQYYERYLFSDIHNFIMSMRILLKKKSLC